MTKWDYLFESDAKLRSLYRKSISTGDSEDELKYVNYFNKVLHHTALEETAKIIKEANRIAIADETVSGGKSKAGFDKKDPYNSSIRYWSPLVPSTTAKRWEVIRTKTAWLSTPVRIASVKSQLEIISIMLYYTKDLTEMYKLIPKHLHSHTDVVQNTYFIPAIKKLYPHKTELRPF